MKHSISGSTTFGFPEPCLEHRGLNGFCAACLAYGEALNIELGNKYPPNPIDL